MPDSAWFSFLTDAQEDVFSDLFSRYPDLAYSAPILMTTADGGKTYSFGADVALDPIRPMGSAELYGSLSAIPDNPLLPGSDFLLEGGLVRMPNNMSRLFASGPYARLVLRPDTPISAGGQPTLPATTRSGIRTASSRH
jgi:hypothetical protein